MRLGKCEHVRAQPPQARGRAPAQKQRSPPQRFSVAQCCAEVFQPALDFKAFTCIQRLSEYYVPVCQIDLPSLIISPTNYTGLNLLQF